MVELGPSAGGWGLAHEQIASGLASRAGAILVSPRLLRRIIKAHRKLPGVGFDVPHGFAYVLDKQALLDLANIEELGCKESELFDRVLLVERPEDDPGTDPTEVYGTLWRRAFHAAIHRELEEHVASGRLGRAEIRARIHAIGQTEFDEIRFVLRQDDLLLPPDDDATTYTEFAATYLELAAFAPETLSRTFPALHDAARIERTLASDVDKRALLERTKPPGAPSLEAIVKAAAPPPEEDVVATTQTSAAHTELGAVSPAADRAKARGNAVRSMLLRVRTRGTELAVLGELREMMVRLAGALRWEDAPVDEWARTLLPLLHLAPAAHRLPWNAAARLLYDLQRVIMDGERELFLLDAVEWGLSRGKVPIKRPVPAQREVHMVKYLVAAGEKLSKTAVAEPRRSAIAELLRAFRKRAAQNLRASLGPRIDAALEEVGLAASNAPERVSKKKLVAELLDQILKHGYISLGHLRDSLSRSNVKMHNLTMEEVTRGDALLRADRILSRSLDGVYRRGEIYLRGLQKLSSIAFGTKAGRVATLYAILPLLAAYVVLEGLQHTLGLLLHWITGDELHFVTPISFPVTAALIFALIHSAVARTIGRRLLSYVGAALRFVFLTVPALVWGLPMTRALVKSRPFVAFVRYVAKPLILGAILASPVRLFTKDVIALGATTGALFLGWNILLNSTIGVQFEEAAADFLARKWRQLRRRVLPGLFGLIADFFRRLLEVVDRFIYSVDELLRFRAGESQLSFVMKASLGVVWFFLTYMIRIYATLLIEPEVNPIKHFPVVTVAAKIMIPFNVPIHNFMIGPLERVMGAVVAEPFVVSTVFFLPGFFGFLTWELKENWRLYAQNRAPALSPVIIGHHGETMVGFMKPGFHSGTVPKVYAKLRRAMHKRKRSAVRHREALHHIEEAIRSFAERELLPLFGESKAWTGGPLEIGRIDVASNRVRVEVRCPAVGPEAAQIAFEEQSGWLLGSIPHGGFVRSLAPTQRIIFENALAGLYKIAGVELVREQIVACIGEVAYDVADEGLMVWPDPSYTTEVLYDIKLRVPLLRPRMFSGASPLPPAIETNRLLFRNELVSWEAWVDAWREDGEVKRLLKGPSLLPAPVDDTTERNVTIRMLDRSVDVDRTIPAAGPPSGCVDDRPGAGPA